MNRWKRRAAAMICAAVMAAAVPAGAAEWISLSDWAYADVSSFVSSGLLPETLADVSDYTRPIKRWEFCELIYSVLDHVGMFKRNGYRMSFEDCEGYTGVNMLYSSFIVSGVQTEDGTYFYPENNITREEAATIVDNAMTQLGLWTSVPYYNDNELLERLGEVINDAGAVHDNAKQSVETVIRYGVMGDTGIGSFEPKKELTVEQAVAVANRMYKGIPQLVTSDSGGITGSGEKEVKELGAGLTETYDGSVYRVKENGTELMSFEADVYSKLFTAESGGRRIVLAVNFNDKTDAYDLDTGELLYTIPYITYKIEDGHAYVYSSRFMPAYSGIYSLDGTELAAPEYSEKELDSIAENGYAVPEEEYRAADGWVYYSNWNDGGSLNKVDSNGENVKCLVSGLDCYDTKYTGGLLYFRAKEDGALYSVDPDGENFVKVADNAEFISPAVNVFNDYLYNDVNVYTDVNGNKAAPDIQLTYYVLQEKYFGGKLVYGERREYIREYVSEDGSTMEYGEDAYVLSVFSVENGKVESKKIADFPVCNASYDGEKLYFLNAEELVNDGASSIYVYDGEDLTTLANTDKAAVLGFYYDGEPIADMTKLCYITPEEIGECTYHMLDTETGEISSEAFKKQADDPKDTEKINYFDDISTDDMTAWRDLETREIYIEYNGMKKDLGQSTPIFREGEWVYYKSGTNGSYGFGSSMPIRQISGNERDIFAYNYVSGEDIFVADDLDLTWYCNDTVYIYATAMLQYRLLENGKSVSVYPNKGIFRYGEPESFDKLREVMWQPDHLYKTDKEGNITEITDCDTEYWIYVPNGAEEPAMQQWR